MAVNVDQLEMDRIDQGVLVYCPLLDEAASYVADMVDLTQDTEARLYSPSLKISVAVVCQFILYFS